MAHVLPRRSWLALVAALVALAVLLAVALSPGGNRAAEFGAAPASADAAAAGKTVKINIKDLAFSKKKVTVRVGQKVKWTNRDMMEHNATTDQKYGPHGPLLKKGKSYTWKATRKGTFHYHCTPHEFMTGTIVVK